MLLVLSASTLGGRRSGAVLPIHTKESGMIIKQLAMLVMFSTSVFPATVLYNAATTALPGTQGWLTYGTNAIFTGGSSTQTLVTGGTRLQTDNAASAGYANQLPISNALVNAAFPLLDRTAGYSLDFDLQVNSESHSSNNRAGFSVILLSQDLLGIELGFWTDQIWAQSLNCVTSLVPKPGYHP